MDEQVIKFLKDRFIGVLSSTDPEGNPQAATIFYVFEGDSGIVFKSRSGSDHMVDLFRHPHAALVVYDHESSYTSKSGVQLKGIVRKIKEPASMASFVSKYSDRFKGAGKKFDKISTLVSDYASSTLYQFDIKEVKFTDTLSSRADKEYSSW